MWRKLAHNWQKTIQHESYAWISWRRNKLTICIPVVTICLIRLIQMGIWGIYSNDGRYNQAGAQGIAYETKGHRGYPFNLNQAAQVLPYNNRTFGRPKRWGSLYNTLFWSKHQNVLRTKWLFRHHYSINHCIPILFLSNTYSYTFTKYSWYGTFFNSTPFKTNARIPYCTGIGSNGIYTCIFHWCQIDSPQYINL